MAIFNKYLTLHQKQQQEFNEFPMAFAFDEKQFDRGMAKLRVAPEDTDKIYEFRGTGGFYRRTDAVRLHEMLNRHKAERQAALDGDITGDGYIYEMFKCELEVHEYTYTEDISDTLEYLGFTMDDIAADQRLRRGLNRAIKMLRRNEVAWI